MGICFGNNDPKIKINKESKHSMEKKENKNIKFHKKEQFKNINLLNDFENETIGFTNIGNSCYINSFLQLLLHCPNFLKKLKKIIKKNDDDCLINDLIKLSKDIKNDYNYIVSIKNHMKVINPSYGTSNQGDSQIFGKDLINEIINYIKGYNSFYSDYEDKNIHDKKKKYEHFKNLYQQNECEIEKMFVINEIKYKYKSKQSYDISFSSFLDIEICFPDNAQKDYSLKNLLDLKYGSNIFKNEKICKIMKKICKLPKILIITISRSILNQELNKSKLKYPINLDFQEYYENIDDREIKTNYELFGINLKCGNSKYNGHCFCYLNINNAWYVFEDKRVEKEEPRFSSENVIGLFYKEIDD